MHSVTVRRLLRRLAAQPTLRQPSHDTEALEHPGSGLRRSDLVVRDGFGLLVQGGGMRGAFAMGALAELHRQGLTESFDVSVGNSAGAIALSYFLAGQADMVSEDYWAAIRMARIFNPLRFWKIVDVDRMVDEGMFQRFPLDLDALRANPPKFLIGLTDARYRLPSYVVGQELSTPDLRNALKATAALPGMYNEVVRLHGRRYIDGGFVDTLPLLRLKVLGCDRIIAVCTTPLRYEFVNDSLLRRSVIKAFAIGHSRFVRGWVGTPNPLHDENLEALMLWGEDPERSRVLPIAPQHRLPDFTDAVKLHEIFELGTSAAQQALQSVTWACTAAS